MQHLRHDVTGDMPCAYIRSTVCFICLGIEPLFLMAHMPTFIVNQYQSLLSRSMEKWISGVVLAFNR